MKKIYIKEAKAIADRVGATMAIVLAFKDDGTFMAASYGRTKKQCDAAGGWMCALCHDLASGRLYFRDFENLRAPHIPFVHRKKRKQSRA